MDLTLLGYLCSVFIGLTLGLLGGGGSILTVPVLHYLFKLDVAEATASSLAVVGLTSAVGAWKAAQKGEVAFKKGLLFAFPALVSVVLTRRFLVISIPNTMNFLGMTITRSFIVMVFFSIIMVFAARAMLKTTKKNNEHKTFSGLSITVQGLWVGIVTGLVGAGGGFLIVPALSLLLNLDMKTAVSTSLFVIALNSLVGFLFSFGSGIIFEPVLLASVCALSLSGLFIGQRLKNRVSQQQLKKYFAYFILTMAAIILFQEFLWIFTHG